MYTYIPTFLLVFYKSYFLHSWLNIYLYIKKNNTAIYIYNILNILYYIQCFYLLFLFVVSHCTNRKNKKQKTKTESTNNIILLLMLKALLVYTHYIFIFHDNQLVSLLIISHLVGRSLSVDRNSYKIFCTTFFLYLYCYLICA